MFILLTAPAPEDVVTELFEETACGETRRCKEPLGVEGDIHPDEDDRSEPLVAAKERYGYTTIH